MTLRLKGVLVQDNMAPKGETAFFGGPRCRAHGPSAVNLHAHGDPNWAISYRKIWLA